MLYTVKLGAEVVSADLDDPESVSRGFSQCYGVYCVTFYWAHFSPETELTHARSMAEAAKRTDVEHAIWSTLEDTRRWVPLSDSRMPTLQEKYKVPHFDAKGEANQFFSPPRTSPDREISLTDDHHRLVAKDTAHQFHFPG